MRAPTCGTAPGAGWRCRRPGLGRLHDTRLAALAGRDIRTDPTTWTAYAALVRSVVEALDEIPTVLLGVATPDELSGWPRARWTLLDCDDDERVARLQGRDAPEEVEEALQDAAEYRALGLPTVDTTGLTPQEVAQALAAALWT